MLVAVATGVRYWPEADIDYTRGVQTTSNANADTQQK
jgi:hypothetical protein